MYRSFLIELNHLQTAQLIVLSLKGLRIRRHLLFLSLCDTVSSICQGLILAVADSGMHRGLAIGGKHQVFDVLQTFQVSILYVSGESLSMLVHSSVLSGQIEAVVLLGLLQLFGLEDILNLLTALRVDVLGVLFNLPSGLYSMCVRMSDGVGSGLDVSCLVKLV